MQSSEVASVVASAIQRAPLALVSRQASAPSKGSARIAERIGKLAASPRHRPGHGGGDAEQHHQSVGVEIAGLDARGEAGAGEDRGGGAVGAEAVDRALVALLPEQAAEPDRGADEQDVVDLVEIPFVEEEAVERRRTGSTKRRREGRCCGCRRRRRSGSRSPSPSLAESFTQSGTAWRAWARCALKATLPAQKCGACSGADERLVEDLPGQRPRPATAGRAGPASSTGFRADDSRRCRPGSWRALVRAGCRGRHPRRRDGRDASPWSACWICSDAAQRGFAEEGQEDQPPGIEAGQQGREHADEEGEAAKARAARIGALDDRVLGEEAGEAEARQAGDLDDADAGDRERADQSSPRR